MKPDERDLAYVWDMLDAAGRIQRLLRGLDYGAFVEDDRTSLAIERLLENVGEAARHVSPKLQRTHPEIPWQGIIGIRNVLAHQYGVVDQRKVWQAATHGIAELMPLLEKLLR